MMVTRWYSTLGSCRCSRKSFRRRDATMKVSPLDRESVNPMSLGYSSLIRKHTLFGNVPEREMPLRISYSRPRFSTPASTHELPTGTFCQQTKFGRNMEVFVLLVEGS